MPPMLHHTRGMGGQCSSPSRHSWQAALTVFTQQPLVRLWASCTSSSSQQAAMRWRLEGPRPKGAGAGGAGGAVWFELRMNVNEVRISLRTKLLSAFSKVLFQSH